MLHASWLTSGGGRLALWAEAETRPVKRRATVNDATEPERGYRSHPFCAKTDELVDALARLWKTSRPGAETRTYAPRERIEVRLPRLGARPVPSPEYIARRWAEPPEDVEDAPLSVWRVNALMLDAESACVLLAGLAHEPGAEAAPIWVRHNPYVDVRALDTRPMRFGADLRYWAAAARLAMRLILRQRYLPAARESQAAISYPYSSMMSAPVIGEWRIAPLEPEDQMRFDALAAAMPNSARAAIDYHPHQLIAVPTSEIVAPAPPDGRHTTPLGPPALLHHFCASAVNALLESWARNAQLILKLPSSEPEKQRSPYYYYSPRPTLTSRWLESLTKRGHLINLQTTEARSLLNGVERWLSQHEEAQRAPFRLCLRLSAPMDSAEDGAGAIGSDFVEFQPSGDAGERPAEPPLIPLPPDADGQATASASAVPAIRAIREWMAARLPPPGARRPQPVAAARWSLE